MAELRELKTRLNQPDVREQLAVYYGVGARTLDYQTTRYLDLVAQFERAFPGVTEASFFSTPGRTEVGGNHTDHNGGRVLAAAVNLDIVALVAPNPNGVVTIRSRGYPPIVVDTRETAMVESERFTSAALARGVCARLVELGYRVGGLDAVIVSDVPEGSGLSSSAAFEVLMVEIQDQLYNEGRVPPITGAQIAQYSENVYFGKPCGLMDQATCMVGGFVTIDFKDSADPLLQKVDFDFAHSGHSVVIVATGSSHADLNEDYAAMRSEMKAVARALGGQVLRDYSKETLLLNLSAVRQQVSDRAILRAFHFYDDDQRVVQQVEALKAGRFDEFLALVNASGLSSWTLGQNVFSCKEPGEQGIPLALAISQIVLGGRGACRVHGGGFAGTIQAFVPDDLVDAYLAQMESYLGAGSCFRVMARPVGAVRVNL